MNTITLSNWPTNASRLLACLLFGNRLLCSTLSGLGACSDLADFYPAPLRFNPKPFSSKYSPKHRSYMQTAMTTTNDMLANMDSLLHNCTQNVFSLFASQVRVKLRQP